MNEGLFLGLLIFLQFSIFVDIQFVKSYFTSGREGSYLKILLMTFVVLITGSITLVTMMFFPETVAKFEVQSMMVVESGLLFFLLIFIKLRITVRILKRARDPEFYDISFFGKKVYRPDVVKKSEIAVYVLTVPFTLITGAYFLANIFSR